MRNRNCREHIEYGFLSFSLFWNFGRIRNRQYLEQWNQESLLDYDTDLFC